MSRRREHGRIASVETMVRGGSLDADATVGATSLLLVDAGDFDEDGGTLAIGMVLTGGEWDYSGAQLVEYVADDETGILTLTDPLAAAAERGDPVHLWDPLYEEAVEYQEALVELDGDEDNPEEVVAEVAEGVDTLPEGDRGRHGESCTLKRISDDEWEVVAVGGRSRRSQRTRWEQDDYYALTVADVAAGTATMPLSHRPNDEALTCVLAGAPQRPTNWVIDYDAQTLTISLSGWERAGDVLWGHYAYRKGVVTAVATVMATVTGTAGDDVDIASSVDTQAGNLLVLFLAISESRQIVSDANGWTKWPGNAVDVVNYVDSSWGDKAYGMQIWTKIADADGVNVGPTVTTSANPNWYPWSVISVDGVTGIADVEYASYDPGVASASPPALDGAHLSHSRTFNSNQVTTYVPPAGATVYQNQSNYRAGLVTDYTTEAASLNDQYGTPLGATEWITCSVKFQ